MRDYIDGRGIPPKRVTSLTWGHPPPCEKAVIQQLWTGPYPWIYWFTTSFYRRECRSDEIKVIKCERFYHFSIGKELNLLQ